MTYHLNGLFKMKYDYGTVEYYSEMFSDIMADVEAEYAPDAAENIYKGFLMAIDSWLEYHSKQTNEYSKFRERVRQTLGVL